MIIGFGSDLVDIRRIEKSLARFGARFEARFFTPDERQAALPKAQKAAFYAKRFAAKEACLKALGSGLRGISWQEMEVRNDSLGAPSLHVCGGAAKKLSRLVPQGYTPRLWLTLSDEPPYAQAVVLIEAVQEASSAR